VDPLPLFIQMRLKQSTDKQPFFSHTMQLDAWQARRNFVALHGIKRTKSISVIILQLPLKQHSVWSVSDVWTIFCTYLHFCTYSHPHHNLQLQT